MQDIVAERKFYDELFERDPENEHIQAGYEEIYQLAFPDSVGVQLLDLGCGTGAHTVRLADRGYDIVAVDLSLVGVRAARERLRSQGLDGHFLVADAEHLPFRDGAFEVTWASLLLHHFPKLDRLPTEIARVTRRRLVALEPNAQNLLTALAFNVLNRWIGLSGMTSNQRALLPGRVSRIFTKLGFGDVRVDYVDRPWSDRASFIRRAYRLGTRLLPSRFSSNKFLFQCRRQTEPHQPHAGPDLEVTAAPRPEAREHA